MTPEVAIFCGDPVVGGTLELVLCGAGYRARFLDPSPADEPAALLNGHGLVLLGPRLDARVKEALLLGIRSRPGKKARVTVVELVATLGEPSDRRVVRVAWPCRVEDLLRQVEAALIDGSSDAGE